MKSVLFLIILLFAACTQFKSPTVSKEESEKRVAESQTENVLSSLEQKPEWLFNSDVCPADVIPETEAVINYLGEGCADNPDGCFEKCRIGDGNACYSLALLIQDKYGAEQKNSEALFLRSCKLGIVSGCTNKAAGTMNLEEMDEQKTLCVANTFEKTCSKNDSWGCTMYGFILYEGNGRKQNTGEAIKILRKACDGTNNDDPACQRAKELEQMYKSPSQNATANANNQK